MINELLIGFDFIIIFDYLRTSPFIFFCFQAGKISLKSQLLLYQALHASACFCKVTINQEEYVKSIAAIPVCEHKEQIRIYEQKQNLPTENSCERHHVRGNISISTQIIFGN